MPPRKLISPTGKPITLPPVRPNAGLEAAFRKRMDAMIAAMNRSVIHWISAQYRANPPEMATDESPAKALQAEMAGLGDRWTKRFDEAAPEMAKYFATKAADRADGAMKSILRRAGFTVKFQMTRTANDVLQATIAEQVGLIRSIPQQYLTQVETLVMQSVSAGHDLKTLTDKVQHQFGVTRRRAAFIARDQNAKASATMTRVRQQELGIEKAKWLHSMGGRHPRPSHLANSGNFYEVEKGWYDPDAKEIVWPGTLPNCRCVSRAVLSGFK